MLNLSRLCFILTFLVGLLVVDRVIAGIVQCQAYDACPEINP